MKILTKQIKEPEIEGVQEQVDDLAESIKDNGLLHPITVHQANGLFYIISGNRRFLACKKLGWTEIDATVREDDGDFRVLQIHENLKRHNLPWYEQIELTAELHELRQEQYGVKKSGPGKDGWSMRDTAKELGVALGKVSEDALLLQAVQADPSLKNIRDKKTALRVVRTTASREEQEEDTGVNSLVSLDTIYFGDSNRVLKRVPDCSFEACITDPPWLRYHTDNKTLIADETTHLVFKEVYRVLKHNSFLYLFCGFVDLVRYQKYLSEWGFQVQEMPLIWHKVGVMPKGSKPWSYCRDYEFILLAVKGNPSLSGYLTPSSIFTAKPPSIDRSKTGEEKLHPNQKPIKLIETLIEQCTFPDAVILDPFAGSGVLGAAAKQTGRNFTLIESDKGFYNSIVERLYVNSETDNIKKV